MTQTLAKDLEAPLLQSNIPPTPDPFDIQERAIILETFSWLTLKSLKSTSEERRHDNGLAPLLKQGPKSTFMMIVKNLNIFPRDREWLRAGTAF